MQFPASGVNFFNLINFLDPQLDWKDALVQTGLAARVTLGTCDTPNSYFFNFPP
jgi:hypothetical protein